MIQIALWLALAALCFAWIFRQASERHKLAELTGSTPKFDYWMLAGFGALIAGIALTG